MQYNPALRKLKKEFIICFILLTQISVILKIVENSLIELNIISQSKS